MKIAIIALCGFTSAAIQVTTAAEMFSLEWWIIGVPFYLIAGLVCGVSE